MSRKEFWEFLESAPGTSTHTWVEWKDQCIAYGAPLAVAAIEALEDGPRSLDYGAVNALRFLGYDVWAHGYDSEYHFTLTDPGATEQKIITPKNLDPFSKLR